jgi:hypothetical protein
VGTWRHGGRLEFRHLLLIEMSTKEHQRGLHNWTPTRRLRTALLPTFAVICRIRTLSTSTTAAASPCHPVAQIVALLPQGATAEGLRSSRRT